MYHHWFHVHSKLTFSKLQLTYINYKACYWFWRLEHQMDVNQNAFHSFKNSYIVLFLFILFCIKAFTLKFLFAFHLTQFEFKKKGLLINEQISLVFFSSVLFFLFSIHHGNKARNHEEVHRRYWRRHLSTYSRKMACKSLRRQLHLPFGALLRPSTC